MTFNQRPHVRYRGHGKRHPLDARKESFLQGVRRVLRPGGSFAFNSVFFVGAFIEEIESGYSEWMKPPLRILGVIKERRRAEGKPPVS